MTPDEYRKIKEAEKEHLRALKKLKSTVRRLERTKKVNQALQRLTGSERDVLDTHQEMLDRLALETAQQEARLEVALENQAQREETAAPAPTSEEAEEVVLQARARQLLQQLKADMGVENPSHEGAADTAPPGTAPSTPRSPKSIGRSEARPEDSKEAPEDPARRPDKTIGRM